MGLFEFLIRLRLLMLLRPPPALPTTPTIPLAPADLSHLARGAELADLPYSAILRSAGRPPPGVTLLGGELSPDVARPAYLVGVDHESGRPFVAVRGTASVRDVLTNLHMGVVRAGVRPTAAPRGSTVHAGYDASAAALAPRVAQLLERGVGSRRWPPLPAGGAGGPRGFGIAAGAAAGGRPFPGLLVVGHSLGGAVASLLALSLRARAPAATASSIEVLSYGSAAVADAGLARWSALAGSAMTTIVRGTDAVPRLSLASLDRLASAVAAAELGEELRLRLMGGLPETLAMLAGEVGNLTEGRVARLVTEALAFSAGREGGSSKRGRGGGDHGGGGQSGGGEQPAVRNKAEVASEIGEEQQAGSVDAAVDRLDKTQAVELFPMGTLVHVTGGARAPSADDGDGNSGDRGTDVAGSSWAAPPRATGGAPANEQTGLAVVRPAVAVYRGDLMRDLVDIVPDERMIAHHLLDGTIAALQSAAEAVAADKVERPARR